MSQSKYISKFTILMMAVGAGLAVGSDYLIQPLIADNARDFGVNVEYSTLFIALSQIAYAMGVIFLTPLSDIFENRKLLFILLLLTTLSLFMTAFSPVFSVFLIGVAGIGLFSVAAQILIPMATSLVPAENRGRTVGTIMSGLLLGILLARIVAGFIADWLDWRAVYYIIGGLVLLINIVLYRLLPPLYHKNKYSYFDILYSVWHLQVIKPLLRRRTIIGGCTFALFSFLWTPLTLLLEGAPYHYSVEIIGLFGIFGAFGVFGANIAGHLADAGRSKELTIISCIIFIISWIFLYFFSDHLWGIIPGIIIIDMSIQFIQISNQSIIYGDDPALRGRITSGYMAAYFAGGVFGSLVSSWLYAQYGWQMVCAAATALSILLLAYVLLGLKKDP